MDYSEGLEGSAGIVPFHETLSNHDLKLQRGKTTTLQINVGFLCNQSCLHCHLSAGPDRKEIMDPGTVDDIVSYASRSHFETIDITGGAPELNPHIVRLIENLAPLSPRIMLRSNLTALNTSKNDFLLDMLRSYRVVIVASLPSLNESQSDSQRGHGSFNAAISTLNKLNSMGYGEEDSGLELNLVSNPTGAFLSPSQARTEERFHMILKEKWGITFNNLFNFANVPLGRFRQWLLKSGNLKNYMDKLVSGFNPCAIEGVMCRSLVSVSWDGYLFDCDFNLAARLFMGGQMMHVSGMPGPPKQESSISIGDHCYTCTAGAGFT
jgi:radical SAM/Cys-rich protein